MKKIGVLYGQENTFPHALVDRINQKGEKGITAEAVFIDKVVQGEPLGYDVIIDRISQDVPFYRGLLKNEAICGAAVINNPFWWSADEKFFNNSLATKLGVPVPKTVLLPSNQLPNDTSSNSFRNLAFPLDWDGIFNYVGWPAYFKPMDGGGWKNVYRLDNPENFFNAYNETGQLVMMLQEEIVFDDYYRCYCIGGKDVRIMQYEPRNPHHLRYAVDRPMGSKKLLDTMKKYVLALNQALGYDFNTVEFAVRNGVPIAIDFCNPAPDADVNSVGAENFEWVIETAANMAIARAKAHKPNQMNLTWGTFVRQSAAGRSDFAAGMGIPAPVEKAKPGRKPGAKAAAEVVKVKGKPGRKPRTVDAGIAEAMGVKVKGKPGRKPKTVEASMGGPAEVKVKGKPGRKPKTVDAGMGEVKVKGKPGRKPKAASEGVMAAAAKAKAPRSKSTAQPGFTKAGLPKKKPGRKPQTAPVLVEQSEPIK